MVLDLVIDKAIDDTSLCVQCANLCKHLSTLSVQKINKETGVREEVKFRQLLMSRCQKDFEANVYADIAVKACEFRIDVRPDDPGQKSVLIAQLNAEKREVVERWLEITRYAKQQLTN